MKFRTYAVPVLMVVVAAHQFYRVQVEDLCSWRGGGFGMYASFHPRHHEAWATRAADGERLHFEKYNESTDVIATPNLRKTVRPLLTWPQQSRGDRALEAINKDQPVLQQLDIYRLAFDPTTGLLTRKLLVSTPSPKTNNE